MVDTIVLTLDETEYSVIKPDNFEPSLRMLNDYKGKMGNKAYQTFKNNPTRQELKNGQYRPRTTIAARFRGDRLQKVLKIEFSAPKMLYGNNFDELTDEDFPVLLEAIRLSLQDQGILIFSQVLANAKVSAIHYSKNIILTDGSIVHTYLSELYKCNVSERLDSNEKEFRNEGHVLKFRVNSFEIVFYDKIRDLQQARKSPKRSEEHEENLSQLGLFDTFTAIRKTRPLEVLRFELRLNKRYKIKQVLREIGATNKLTFSGLFKLETTQKVLLYFLDELEACYPKPALFSPKNAKEELAIIVLNNPRAQIKDVMAFIGMTKVHSELSPREVRQYFGRRGSNSWYGFNKRMAQLAPNSKPTQLFKPIRDQIREYKPARMVDFKDRMLNNDKYE